MDKNQIITIVQEYAQRVIKEFQVLEIIVYGSAVKGNFTDNSDIDVAVIVDKLTEDILTSEFKLYKLRRDIDYRIEPKIFEGFQDKSGFLEEILKTGTIIYRAA